MDQATRLAVGEERMNEARSDIVALKDAQHRFGNKLMELEKAALLVKQDVGLIKKLTFGACALILAAFVGNVVKMSTEYSQIESLKKIILETRR